MYKLRSVEKILDEWKDQMFLNKKCTYGDDRHLTNKILSLSEIVIYTPIAKAETETPSSMYRFYKQQVRWSKSAFREFFWSIKMVNNHSVFMTVDLIYVLIYPYIVMGYLMYILWCGSIIDLGLYCCILLILGTIKSFYGCIMSNNFENMFYLLYVVSYLTIVFPAKIWALINLNDNSWGTSSRKILNNNFSVDILVPVVWNITLLSGLCFNITKSVLRKTPMIDYIYIIVASSFWLLIFNVMLIYVYVKRRNQKKIN
jgi:hyaluronan synthase